MPDIQFICPQCGKHLTVDEKGAGLTVPCPECKGTITIPKSAPAQESERLNIDYGGAFGMEDAGDMGVASAVNDAVKEFKALDYNYLIPFSKIFSAELLRKKAVRWVLMFGLLPLAFWQAASMFDLEFTQVLWLIEIYFCLFWALYFYSIIQPSKTIWRRAIGYSFFTASVGVVLLLIAQALPIVRNLYAGTESNLFLGRVIGNVLGVGVFEETCKALPLIIFGLRKKTLNGTREGVFLGLMSGFGFAAAEGVQYTTMATANIIAYGGSDAATAQVLMFLHRVMSGPILHAAWAGVVGWFIGVASVRKGAKWPIVVVGILFMAVLHGIHDVFAGGPFILVTAAASLITFMAYLAHGQAEGQTLAKT